MSYTSQQNLIVRFGQAKIQRLTDRATPAAGAIDATVVDQALADTDAIIDAYLAVRYQLPLLQVPSLLADLALSIAYYKLHVQVTDEKVLTDYNDARKTLQMISAGTMKLDVAGVEPAASTGDLPESTTVNRPLGGDMPGMI